MLHNIGKKVLITTSAWFIAPDGKQYRAVHGTLKGVHESGKTLGFIPNRAHANWYIEVGAMFIMGCQALYIIECEEVPNAETIREHTYSEATGTYTEILKPNPVFITD